MNGILVYDETKEAAIWKCRGLARLVFLESLGAIEILEIKEKGTSVLIK